MKENKELIIATLINVGFTRVYDNDDYTWVYRNYRITLRDSTTMAQLFKKLIDMGEELKMWEIKSVLNILQ